MNKEQRLQNRITKNTLKHTWKENRFVLSQMDDIYVHDTHKQKRELRKRKTQII